jgi:hypothetical protein
MSRKGLTLLVSVLALAVPTTACSNNETGTNAGRTSEAAITAGATATVSPTSASGGGAETDGAVSLPAGFPESFPIPDSAVLVQSLGADGYVLGFSSGQTLNELRSFFDENLPHNGWSIDREGELTDSQGRPFTLYEISGHGFYGSLYVHGSPTPPGEFPFSVGLFPE